MMFQEASDAEWYHGCLSLSFCSSLSRAEPLEYLYSRFLLAAIWPKWEARGLPCLEAMNNIPSLPKL